jgi:hypothetical protein
MAEAEVPRRPVAKRFAKGEWETLHEIILKGDGGKFREILHDRNVSTNMLKADMWGKITYLFCEVCTGYILFSMLGIRNRIQIRIYFYRFCTRLRILLAEGRQMKQRSLKYPYLNFVCTVRHYTITYKLPYIYKATVNMYTYTRQLSKKIILIQLLIII